MEDRNPPTNRGILNIDKDIKENVTGNRGIINIDKERYSRGISKAIGKILI